MIRVVVAEDQSMVLGALAALLEIESDIEVIGRAHDGREALGARRATQSGYSADRHRDAGAVGTRGGRRGDAPCARRRA